MTTLLLIIQLIIVSLMVVLILLQKTGADSLSGLSGSGHGVFSHRSRGDILTKATAVLAICFICNSLLIAKVVQHQRSATSRLIDSIGTSQPMEEKKLEAPEAAQ